MNKDYLNIEIIKDCLRNNRIIWTEHCLNRINQRDILISDVKNAIKYGTIIEYYYEDYPYPSCLILGKKKNKENIHIVCGVNKTDVYVITAYNPNSEKWEDDMKTRRNK